MNDKEYGKRLVEEMILEQLLDYFPEITGRAVTDEAEGEFAQISASPDFIVGLDGRAFGIELAEIRNVDDAYAYLDGGGDCRLDALSGDGHKKVISSARKLVRLTAQLLEARAPLAPTVNRPALSRRSRTTSQTRSTTSRTQISSITFAGATAAVMRAASWS